MENSIIIRCLTIEELKSLITSAIKQELEALHPKKGETIYLTRKETASFLKISIPTLHEYTKRGIVKGFRVGSRVLYKLSDLEEDLRRIEISRYRRGI